MLAVMDGCSMGTDSHFASTLIGKILKKKAKEMYFREFAERAAFTLSEALKEICQGLFSDLKTIKNLLNLEKEELLSTLILGVLDINDRKAEILAIGDGLVACNGYLYEFDQDNTPDYLGYHLQEDFKTWYHDQEQRLSLDQIQDLSLSTDGIFTFRKYNTNDYPAIEEEKILAFLLQDNDGCEQSCFLHKKLLSLEKEWGLRPTDDLSIIRLVLDAVN